MDYISSIEVLMFTTQYRDMGAIHYDINKEHKYNANEKLYE